LQAIEAAALQPNIEEHEAGPARNNRGQRLIAVSGGASAMAFILQNAGHQLPDVRLIVYN